MNRNIRFNDSNNFIYDFKELDMICFVDDVSYQTHSVLDFIDIDLSGNIQIDPEFANLNRIDLSFTTISQSVIYIPIDRFQNLFKFNIRKNEIMNDDFDHIRFAIDRKNWNKNNYKIPFSQSYVYPSAALNVRSKISKQNIENDMLRSMVKDITGSLKFTGIFNNLNQIKDNIVHLDASINENIVSVLETIGGTMERPYNHKDISNNPVRDFITGILNSDSFKLYRKHRLLDDLADQTDDYFDNNIMNKFYIYGNSFKGLGYYYPVYINKGHPDLYIGYKIIKFAQYKDKFFFVNPIVLNVVENIDHIPSNILNYDDKIENKFINVPFIYGDTIQMKILYKPKNNIFSNRFIYNRSYQISLVLGLESNYEIDFSDEHYIENSKIGNNSHNINYFNNDMKYIDISGNYNFELLWLGSQDRTNLFFSHVHYYPFLYNISNMLMTLYIEENKSPFCIHIQFRPRINVHDSIKLILKSESILYNGWKVYSLTDFYVLLNDINYYESLGIFKDSDITNKVTHSKYKYFKKEISNEATNYNTHLYLNEGQQLLSISLISKDNSINCKLHHFAIHFNDNHIIKIKLK